MDWKTKAALETTGRVRAVAVPVKDTSQFDKLLQTRENVFSAYKIRENVAFRIEQLVGSLAILDDNFRIPTARNIGRLTSISGKAVYAFCDAMVELDYFEPWLCMINPYKRQASHNESRAVIVRPAEVGGVAVAYRLTEQAQAIMTDENLSFVYGPNLPQNKL